MVNSTEMDFVDDEMASDWYLGRSEIAILVIETEKLASIRANAFASPAFRNLKQVTISSWGSSVELSAAALGGVDTLQAFFIGAERISGNFLGLFDSVDFNMKFLRFFAWPNDISLNEMFANGNYRSLKALTISNIPEPQTKFHLLAASNFTSFGRLKELTLTSCGIRVIEERAFATNARTLKNVDLRDNAIKFIDSKMFRRIFETKIDAILWIYSKTLACTCSLVELSIILCPFQEHSATMCFKCESIDYFDVTACGIKYAVDVSQICINWKPEGYVLIVDIRMGYDDDNVFFNTSSVSDIRMILVDLDGMRGQKCTKRASNATTKCMKIHGTTGQVALNEIDEIRAAEIVLITAIPILYAFGARPMHSMTARRLIARDENDTPDYLLWIAVISMILGSIAGFVLSFCFAPASSNELVKPSGDPPCDHASTVDLIPDDFVLEYYTTPTSECEDDKTNYIEILDTYYSEEYYSEGYF